MLQNIVSFLIYLDYRFDHINTTSIRAYEKIEKILGSMIGDVRASSCVLLGIGRWQRPQRNFKEYVSMLNDFLESTKGQGIVLWLIPPLRLSSSAFLDESHRDGERSRTFHSLLQRPCGFHAGERVEIQPSKEL